MDPIEHYIDDLHAALRRRAIQDHTLADEVRDHLIDAAASERAQGLSPEMAAARAIERVGAPHVVADAVADDHAGSPSHWPMLGALVCGAAIAYVDSRPGWDDTGITAGALFLTSAAWSFFVPRRAWLLALGVGGWIPAAALVSRPVPRTALMLIVLAFPITGALIGRLVRWVVADGSLRS